MVIQGIIRPPPEIRAVADRTAKFVSKNGRAFEQRILNSDKGKTPKFAFLHDTSPFNAYYEDRIRFYEEGGDDDDDDDEDKKQEDVESKVEKKEEETTDDKSKDVETLKDKETTKNSISEKRKASAVDIVARTILAQRSLITTASESSPPASSESSNNATSHSTPDTMNLVKPPPALLSVTIPAPSRASPVAIEIMKLSAQMTALNGEFLRELTAVEYHNPMFAFTQPRHGHFAYFTALVDCYKKLLMLGEEEEEEESLSLVGSLLSHKSENDIMTCLEHAAYRSEYNRYTSEKKDSSENASANIAPSAATIDWHDFVVVETITFPKDEIVTIPPPPPPLPVDSTTPLIPTSPSINIVPDYKPRLTSTQSTLADPSRTHVLDPITNQSIPLSDMSEHLRIQLLDPKWAKEKEVFQKKQSESNYVTGGDIARNLGWFVDKKKGDEGVGMEREVESTTSRGATRLEEANRVLRDVGVPTKQEVMQMQQDSTKRPVETMPPPPPPMPTGIPPGLPPPLPDDDADVRHIDKKPRMVLVPPPPPMPTGIPPGLPPPPPFVDGAQATTVTAAASAPIHNSDATASRSVPPPPPTVPPRAAATTTDYLPEDDYIQTLTSPHATLSITLPSSSPDYASLDGRTVSIPATVQSTVKSIKNLLFKELKDMPVNKMQLKDEERGFLKDGMTLARLNLGGDGRIVVLDLVPKVRGRRNR